MADERTLSWGVPRRFAIGEGTAALVFAAGALWTGEPAGRSLATLAALLLGGLALRDAAVRTRLAADARGVTVVKGFAGRQRLAWTTVERVRVDERTRLGLRSRLLEIDAGESLHLLSSRELGADPRDVAATLAALRG